MFLNKKMNKKMNKTKNEVSFIPPSKCKETPEQERQHPNKIVINETMILLTSDTFGFSVAGGGLKKLDKDIKYPYSILYNKVINDNTLKEEDKRNMYTFIAHCIYDTRTVGGAFLWPTSSHLWFHSEKKEYSWSRADCLYNWKRGIGSYIEDRVDLTLLEIKKYYGYKGDILFKCLSKDENEYDRWFSYFENYSDYINTLMFHPFVVSVGSKEEPEYVPIDIVNSVIKEKGEKAEGKNDPFGENDYIDTEGHIIYPLSSKPTLSEKSICDGCKLKDCCEMNKTEIKEIQECLVHNSDRLKRMLNNVRLLTLERSRMMTAFIDNPNENEWKNLESPWTEKNGKWYFKMTQPSES